jgi:hypothetical protein
VTRGWKTVQQEHRGGLPIARLAIEDFAAANLCGLEGAGCCFQKGRIRLVVAVTL